MRLARADPASRKWLERDRRPGPMTVIISRSGKSDRGAHA